MGALCAFDSIGETLRSTTTPATVTANTTTKATSMLKSEVIGIRHQLFGESVY